MKIIWFLFVCLMLSIILMLASCSGKSDNETETGATETDGITVSAETTVDGLDHQPDKHNETSESSSVNPDGQHETSQNETNNQADTGSAEGSDIKNDIQQRPDLPSGTLRLWWPLSGMTNPLLTDSRSAQAVFSLVFDSLYRIGEDQMPEPVLAQDMTDPADAAKLTIQIRSGLFFHDGQELTAADVGATMQFILDHADLSPYAQGLASVDSIDWSEESPYTLHIRLSGADPWIIYALTFPILQQQALDTTYASDALLSGTGLYEMQGWEDGQLKLSLHKRPSDQSALKHIQVRFYPDQRAALNGFASDEIDLIALDADTYQIFRPRTNLRFHLFAGSRQIYLSYQTESGSLLADEQRFLALKQLLHQNLYQNINHVFGQHTAVPLLVNNGVMDMQQFNPAAVLASFGQAKWEAAQSPVRIIWPASDQTRASLADEISQQLEEADIDWIAEAVPDEAFAETVQKGEYDLALLEAVLPAQPDPSWLYLSLFDQRLDRHELSQAEAYQTEMSSDGQAGGVAFSDYRTWQNQLQTIWHEKTPQRLLPASEMALLASHTAARAPWDALVIRTEALVYGDRILGRSTPNRYQIFEGIEALWVWSTQ